MTMSSLSTEVIGVGSTSSVEVILASRLVKPGRNWAKEIIAIFGQRFDETKERLSAGTYRKWRKRLEEGGEYPKDWAERWKQHKARKAKK